MTTDRRDIALRQTLAVSLFLFGVALLVGHCIACTPAELAQDAAASGYEAQQMRCVEQYARKVDIDICRMRVKLEWSTVDAGGDR
jgi:hypothetical protein